ncbi:MAG: hypothetical protein VCD33_05380 [Alphaproteobacteria bacterium]|jgi:hypothetical protein
MKPTFTIAAAALLLAIGPAFAGGMPSDEGPEILLEEGEETFTPINASSLDSELPEFTETTLAAIETSEFTLPPASDTPAIQFVAPEVLEVPGRRE